jgi:hypothetical protein
MSSTLGVWVASLTRQVPPVANVVQTNTAFAAGPLTTVTLNGVTPGNTLIALAAKDAQNSLSLTLTTTAGSTGSWTIDANYAALTYGTAEVGNAQALSSSVTVQFSFSGGAGQSLGALLEVKGAVSFDGFQAQAVGASGTVQCGANPLVPTKTGDLFVTMMACGPSPLVYTAIAAPFTALGATGNRVLGGYYVQPLSTGLQATYSISTAGSNFVGLMAAYKLP